MISRTFCFNTLASGNPSSFSDMVMMIGVRKIALLLVVVLVVVVIV